MDETEYTPVAGDIVKDKETGEYGVVRELADWLPKTAWHPIQFKSGVRLRHAEEVERDYSFEALESVLKWFEASQ